MEKYTETAAIEEHSLSTSSYKDDNNHDCVNSKKAIEITLYMRNPKKFSMTPSINFEELPDTISSSLVSTVSIEQNNSYECKLKLPQEFLLALDEGKNISSAISLYEPNSGRTFEKYKIPLYCNSIPPLLQNATIINDGGTYFVVAFDMPDKEELRLRHKDISSININGIDYPLSISQDGSYTFSDSRFYSTPKDSFLYIDSKTFTHSSNSIYFDTNDLFTHGEKTYTLGLKDSAGLIQTVYSSTVISRLSSPIIKDSDNNTYTNGSNSIVSGNSENPFNFTITPPVTDHKGNTVSGANINYSLYKGTNTVSTIIKAGSSTDTVSLSLDNGTYYLESYATLTNYEQSPITKIHFKVIDNIIYISEDGDDSIGDGSIQLPWATLNAAMADIELRNLTNTTINLYVDGTIDGNVLVNAVNTKGINICQKPDSRPAVIRGQATDSTVKITTTVPVSFKNIKITGGNAINGGGIYAETGTKVNLETGTVITENQASSAGGGIYLNGPYTKLTIAGCVTVYGNTTNGNSSNVYLKDGQTIEITDALVSTGTNLIGVSTQSAPSLLAPITITSGYGYNSGFNKNVVPGTFFIGDTYAISNTNTGEAALFLDEGSFTELLSSLDISFAIDHTSFIVGSATEFVITPTITVITTGSTRTIDYNSVKNKITWNIILKNSTQIISGVTSTTNTITIPQTVIAPDNYKLIVTAVYDGLYTFDHEFDITGTVN